MTGCSVYKSHESTNCCNFIIKMSVEYNKNTPFNLRFVFKGRSGKVEAGFAQAVNLYGLHKPICGCALQVLGSQSPRARAERVWPIHGILTVTLDRRASRPPSRVVRAVV